MLCFVAALSPLAGLLYHAWQDALGANPIEKIIHVTGFWTLTFLMLTLAATPLRQLFSWSWPLRIRRQLGLFAFFYALLHFLSYLVLDQFFDWSAIGPDILKRREDWFAGQLDLDPEHLVFIDETWTSTSMTRFCLIVGIFRNWRFSPASRLFCLESVLPSLLTTSVMS